MKIWQKIAVGVMALIVAVLAVLLVRGLFISGGGGSAPGSEQNPIFPFDSQSGDGFFGNEGVDEDEDEVSFNEEEFLWQVTDKQVAGAGWVKRSSQNEPVLWHVLKENGHVFESSEEEREPERIINTTIPSVQEALVAPDGSYVIYRYLEDDVVKTYLGNLENSTNAESEFSVNGTFLADNITEITLSPDGSRVFYLQPAGDETAGVVYTPKTDEREVVWRSGVNEWHLDWPQESRVTLTTAPARGVVGFSYVLNPNTGALTKNNEGDALTTLSSRIGDYHFSGSYSNNRTYQAEVVETSDDNPNILNTETTAGKCGWAQDVPALFCGVPSDRISQPLKAWYQGRLSFNDQLYLFNPAQDTEARLFGDEELAKGPFDIIGVSVDQGFNLLSFTNKRDGSLWAFEL